MGLEDSVQGRDPDHQQGLARHRLETTVPTTLFKDNSAGCASLPLLAMCLLPAGLWEHCGKIDRCSYCPLQGVM